MGWPTFGSGSSGSRGRHSNSIWQPDYGSSPSTPTSDWYIARISALEKELADSKVLSKDKLDHAHMTSGSAIKILNWERTRRQELEAVISRCKACTKADALLAIASVVSATATDQ